MSGAQTTFDVATSAELDAAIADANAEGAGAAITITLTGDITEAADTAAMVLAAGVSLTIDGAGHTLDGDGLYRGFKVDSGAVTIENLTIANALAAGGNGASGQGSGGGGGGAGLGGGLFVRAGGYVTLAGVDFANDAAVGGNGGSNVLEGYGTYGDGGNGGDGPTIGSGGVGATTTYGQGGAGQFGGGGGGGAGGPQPSIGIGGAGGFGGGAGNGASNASYDAPGFGGGVAGRGGGGGLAAGGDIFVQQGGSLTIGGGSLNAGTLTGGINGNPDPADPGDGQAYGSAIFLQGTQTLDLAPLSDQTLTIGGGIADEQGSDPAASQNSAGLLLNGAGTVVLDGANTYSGGVTLASGTLSLGAGGSLGNPVGDAVSFSGTSATLAFSTANPVSGTITGFTGNDAIVISNFAYSAQESVTASNDDVTLTAPDGSVLDLTMQGADTQDFALHSADGGSATVLTLAGPVLIESLIDDTGPGAVTTDPDLTGTTDTPGTLSFSEGGTLLGTLAASPGQPWHFSPAGLATGAHTITVSQTNATGVTGTASITFTLESATYGAPVVTAALAHDTGVSASDGITANPSLTGTADPDANVIFTQIGFFLGTTTASSTGQWQFTPIGLPDGERNIVATDTNAAGQTGTATVNFTLLTSAAAPRGLSLDTGSDSGVQGDHLTNVTTPTLAGYGDTGDTVNLYDGSTLLGTAIVSRGAWSVAGFTLSDGSHSLTATETDLAGNVSAAATFALAIDTSTPTAPSAPTLASGSDSGVPGDDVTDVTTPTLTGTGVTGDVVALYDGNVVIGTASVAGGIWSITSAILPDGVHDLHDTQTSPAGNVSAASATLALTIDTATPATPATPALSAASDSGAPGDGVTNVTDPVITGTGSAGDTVTLYDGSQVLGLTLVSVAGSWSLAAGPLSDGAHSLYDTQNSPAGNVSAASGTLALSIDTTTPATLPAPVLSPGSYSGVAGDHLTNVTAPMITGTGSAGDTVILYDGIDAIGTATVTAGGDWTITASTLSAGVHSLTTTQANAAGSGSATSQALVLTIETAAPAASSAPSLAPGSDSGVAGDDLTNVAAPTLTGTGLTGDTVTLYDGTLAIGTANVVADIWSIAAPAFADGVYVLHSAQADAAGNISAASGTLALTIDTATPAATSAPTLSAASDSGTRGDNLTNTATPTLTGTGSTGDTVTLYDGGTAIGTTTVVTSAWSIATPTLGNGTHVLHSTQTDAAGNLSAASATLTLTIDTTPPAAPSTPVLASASDSGAAGDDVTNVTSPMVSGTGITGDTVTLYDGGTAIGTAQIVGGVWSIAAATLADGVHALHSTQTDAAGNISAASATLALTIDTSTPPAAATPALAPSSDIGVQGDGITSVADPVITGTGIAGDTVTLYDGSLILGTATVAAGGAWSLAAGTLGNGAHGLHDTQTSPAGNISAASGTLALTIDAATPATLPAPLLSPASDSGVSGDGVTNIATPTITGTGTAGDTVILYDGITAIGTARIGADGAWSITASLLADGVHTLTAAQTSIAGDVSANSAPLAITIDTSVPASPSPPVLSPASDSGIAGDGLTNVTSPTLTGTGIAGDTVALYDGGHLAGSSIIAANGQWSIIAAPLADGLHSLTTRQTDPAGTDSAPSAPLLLTIDTATPSPTTLTPTDSQGLTGAASPGSSIILRNGTSRVGAATARGDGIWYFLPSSLAAGAYQLTATVADQAGNASAPSDALAVTVASDHSFMITTSSAGTTTVSHYSAADLLETEAATQPAGIVVTRTLGADGTLLVTQTISPQGLVLQSVTPAFTLRNIYDAAGNLIGTVTEAGSATGTAPPNYQTVGVAGGADTQTDATPNVVHLLSENQTLVLSGNDHVVIGTGDDTINADAASASVDGGSGSLVFYGGTGASTVTGGTGVATLVGGAGGGLYAGGTAAGNLLVGTGGSTTLVGGASHDILFTGSGQNTVFGSAGGNDTIVGGAGTDAILAGPHDAVFAGAGQSTVFSNAAGYDTMIGGDGTATMVAEGGNDVLWGGAGQETVFGGTGDDTLWTGTGRMVAVLGSGDNRVILQSASASIYEGAGHTIYDVLAAPQGGDVIISGFKPGDQVALFGFTAPATEQVIAGSTMLTCRTALISRWWMSQI